MPLHNNPRSLEELSRHRMATHLTMQLLQFIQILSKIDITTLNQNVNKMCNYIRQVFPDTIPASIANDLVYEILREMDELYKDIRCYLNEPWCKRSMQNFVVCILNRQVTELKVNWHWKYIVNSLSYHLPNMRKFKDVKLLRQSIFLEIKGAPQKEIINLRKKYKVEMELFKTLPTQEMLLQKVKLYDICTNEMLEVISKTCRIIKHLDILGSINVTDDAVASILNCQLLQKLVVRDTSITIEGRERLLNGLLQDKKNQMTVIGCNQLSDTVLNLLSQFPNLRKLYTDSVCSESEVHYAMIFWISGMNTGTKNVHLEPTQDALSSIETISQNIKVLKMDYRRRSYFPYPAKSLEFLGRNLIKLEFEAIEMNVSHLVFNCPNLRTLKMRVNKILSTSNTPIEFPSLQNLTLIKTSLESSYNLLSICTNLINLELCTTTCDAEHKCNFLNVLHVNPMKSLKVLRLGSFDRNINVQTVSNFIAYCNSLKVLQVFSDKYDDLCKVFRKIPGVEVSKKLCLQVPNERIRTGRMFGTEWCRTGLIWAVNEYEKHERIQQ